MLVEVEEDIIFTAPRATSSTKEPALPQDDTIQTSEGITSSPTQEQLLSEPEAVFNNTDQTYCVTFGAEVPLKILYLDYDLHDLLYFKSIKRNLY